MPFFNFIRQKHLQVSAQAATYSRLQQGAETDWPLYSLKHQQCVAD
jgi:hypothetical protein